MGTPSPPFNICIHAEFNGYGDYFSISAKDVEYVEISGGFPVGDVVLTRQVSALGELAPKWSRLAMGLPPLGGHP